MTIISRDHKVCLILLTAGAEELDTNMVIILDSNSEHAAQA